MKWVIDIDNSVVLGRLSDGSLTWSWIGERANELRYRLQVLQRKYNLPNHLHDEIVIDKLNGFFMREPLV